MALNLPRFVGIVVFVTFVLWLTYLSSDKLRYTRTPPAPIVEIPRYEVWGIRDLREEVQLSSLRVRPVFEAVDLSIKQSTNFTIPFTDVNLTQPIPDLYTDLATIVAPKHIVPDASHLLIGLATELDRLRNSLLHFVHWAPHTNVQFIILVAPPIPGGTTVEEIKELYESHGIRVKFIISGLPWYEKWVHLLGVLHDHCDQNTKWTGIMDDDTYFFSMKRILAMLGKYDHREPYYIGGLSENKETLDRLGYLGYGGGGVFFSVPLLKQLRPHIDTCMTMPDAAGDIRASRCIYTYTTTKLTWEHYLFQMDIHGDLTGFYEAARTRPLSTHHWQSWHFQDMVKIGAIGQVCGNECVLQKYITQDGWKLTNGFSLVKYSYSEEEEHKYIEGAMEHTWADTAWVIPTSWNYTLAPLKPKDFGKVQFLIEKVEEDNDFMTLYYVRRRDGLGEGIIRMSWEKPRS